MSYRPASVAGTLMADQIHVALIDAFRSRGYGWSNGWVTGVIAVAGRHVVPRITDRHSTEAEAASAATSNKGWTNQ